METISEVHKNDAHVLYLQCRFRKPLRYLSTTVEISLYHPVVYPSKYVTSPSAIQK